MVSWLQRGEGQPAKKFPSKSGPIRYGKEKLLADARILFERGLRDFCPRNKSLSPIKGSGGNKCDWAVTALSIGASGMSTVPSVSSTQISHYYMHCLVELCPDAPRS